MPRTLKAKLANIARDTANNETNLTFDTSEPSDPQDRDLRRVTIPLCACVPGYIPLVGDVGTLTFVPRRIGGFWTFERTKQPAVAAPVGAHLDFDRRAAIERIVGAKGGLRPAVAAGAAERRDYERQVGLVRDMAVVGIPRTGSPLGHDPVVGAVSTAAQRDAAMAALVSMRNDAIQALHDLETSMTEHEGADAVGRCKGTWSAKARQAARALLDRAGRKSTQVFPPRS